MTDPLSIKGFRVASERILSALKAKETICLYGDFDMDGLSGTALLFEFLTHLNGKVSVYIPNRIDEGYGMNIEALKKIAEREVSLVISIDCGIKAIDEVDFLNKKGIDCIITDHHEPGKMLPDAVAVLNPKLLDNGHAISHLSGAGVAFELAYAVLKVIHERKQSGFSFDLKTLLDYVALGTIADVVPLKGENRILVKHGLSVLGKTGRIGIKEVMSRAQIKKKPGCYHVAFLIAPRFNAAGRLGKTQDAFNLLISSNCLLYTSPSPRDLSTSRMPSSA